MFVHFPITTVAVFVQQASNAAFVDKFRPVPKDVQLGKKRRITNGTLLSPEMDGFIGGFRLLLPGSAGDFVYAGVQHADLTWTIASTSTRWPGPCVSARGRLLPSRMKDSLGVAVCSPERPR